MALWLNKVQGCSSKRKSKKEQRDIIISNLAKEYSGAAISEKELKILKS
jgi:hypothetical protein